MKTYHSIVPFLFFLLYTAFGDAQIDGQDTAVLPSLLESLPPDGIAEVVIETDLKALSKNRKTDDYQEGTMQIDIPGGTTVELPMKIRCRGKFRRMRCNFPPLKLKFKKGDLKEAGLAPMNELKMVTHCIDDGEKSRDMIAREYLAYRLYELLEPNHLQVRLVRVQYKGGSRRMSKMRHYAILVEHIEDFSSRIGLSPYERMGIMPHQMDTLQCLRTSLFQYMIGNVDFSFETCRNLELMQRSDSVIIAIPYDFDFSYLVSAPYAKPNVNLGQRELNERKMIGYPLQLSAARPVIDEFLARESDILQYTAFYPLLSVEVREKLKDYLKSFFNTLRDDAKMEQILATPVGF